MRKKPDLASVMKRLSKVLPGAKAHLTPDEVRAILPKLRAAVDHPRYWLEEVGSDGTIKILASSDNEGIIRAAYWDVISRMPRRKVQIRRGEEVIAMVTPLS
jgi:hypothetical protein